MAKFKITGIDPITNELVGLDVEAANVMEARDLAGARGLRHVAITPHSVSLDESPPPTEPDSGRTTDTV